MFNDIVDYLNDNYKIISTGGSAVDFGDLSTGSAYSCGFSNAHGGL